MIEDFTKWCGELMRTGRIPPDSDSTFDQEQAELDCRRYVELVEMVRGDEGRKVFDALLASMQVPEDYEVYEATVRVLHLFKTPDVGEWLYYGWDGLARRSPERAWDLLNQLARGWFSDGARNSFNRAWGKADSKTKAAHLEAVVSQEADDGWLESDLARGRLRPVAL